VVNIAQSRKHHTFTQKSILRSALSAVSSAASARVSFCSSGRRTIDGRQLVTLEDAANYIQKLPEAEQLLEGVVGRPARV
jgi:hypothetical protein